MTAQGKVLLNFRYAYDGNGNCTEKSRELYQNTYTYDRMNCLTGSIQDGKGVRYTYDSAETGKVIRFLFDRGELAEERREDAQKGNTYSDRSRRNIYYYVLHG